MEIIAVTLLVLRCADIERSRAFYESLGFHLQAEKHGSGPEHYSMRIGALVLELYPLTDAETRGLRIGFSVADLSTALQAIQRNGYSPIRVTLEASPPQALIRDPDGHWNGHWIELTEVMETSGQRPSQ
jgi:lactoylglutathione lyase